MEILDEVPESQWQFWEREYIRVFRAIGVELTNQLDGGEGGPTFKGRKHSKETREKIAAANLGKKKSKETCEKMSTNRIVTESMRAAVSRANKIRVISDETRKKRSESLKKAWAEGRRS